MQFDITLHNPNPSYLRSLIDEIGVSQRKAAHMIGISERMMRYYLVDPSNEHYKPAPYLVQFALEFIAANKKDSQPIA